jgi:methylenetetrahydrofolate--tRNA-(uracil-5-)-methyltransferase
MNINYGLLPPIATPLTDDNGKRIKGKDKSFARKRAASRRALADLAQWLREADAEG